MSALCPRCGYAPHDGRCRECDGTLHDVAAFGRAMRMVGITPTERQAEALYHVVACNLSYRAAGARMGVEAKTVEVHLYQAARGGGTPQLRHRLLLAYGAALAAERQAA